jgi:hypothetical protein
MAPSNAEPRARRARTVGSHTDIEHLLAMGSELEVKLTKIAARYDSAIAELRIVVSLTRALSRAEFSSEH